MIEKFKAKVARNVRGTHVAVGQDLYAIRFGDLYFIWCYTDRPFAEQMDAKLIDGPKNATDQAANWRRTIGELVPSNRTNMTDPPRKEFYTQESEFKQARRAAEAEQNDD